MADLIQSIVTSRADALPGEPVEVVVALRPEGAGATVAIAGLRGTAHVLQAPVAPGQWRIPVVATLPGGGTDRGTVSVTVGGSAPVVPRLAVEPDPFTPYSMVFSFPLDTFPPGTVFDWLVGPVAATTTDPVLVADLRVAVDDRTPFVVLSVEVAIRYPDGTSVRPHRTLTLGSVYQVIRETGRISPPVTSTGIATRRLGAQPGAFDGELVIRNLEPVELVLTSMQLRWQTADPDDVWVSTAPTAVDLRVAPGASYTHSVRLDRSTAPAGSDACVVHLTGAAGDLPAHVEVAFELRTLKALVLPDVPQYRTPWPGEIEEWALDVLRRVNPQVAGDDRGLTTHGMWVLDRVARAAGRPATAGAPQQALRRGRRLNRRAVDPVSDRFFASRRGTTPEALQAARIGAFSVDVPMQTMQHHGVRSSALLEEGVRRLHELLYDAAIVPGTPCDPDNLPDGVPEGMACQYTGTMVEKLLPDRVMNAEKGDIFLSPGGGGAIGGLLKQVTPPQRYSHTGICTKNRLELAHATAADKWLKEQHTGGIFSGVFPLEVEPAPSDGLRPTALKYIWPGGVIQGIRDAMAGSDFQAPNGKAYSLSCLGRSGYAQFGENWEVIPAVIVKPHPLQDSAAVRTKLHAVADAARALCVTGDDSRQGKQSKLHYRFYAYTDAAVDSPAPEGTGWAVGTVPAVCSSFIWLAAQRAGVQHFEGGALEPEDLDPRSAVELRPGIRDGLYHYTAAERADAAEWLYDYYQDDVMTTLDEESGGGFLAGVADLFSDIADDVANQILNAFAHDWTDVEAKDSERWRDEPRDGTAVSPDDLMHWDGPDKGGLWGTVVPMDYRTPRPELVPTYAWRQTTGPGTLTGVVRFKGQPAGGADVRVGGRDVDVDAAGRFTVELLEGDYVVEAGMHVDGVGYVETKAPVTVLFDDTVEVTIDLREPPDVYRRLVATARGTIRDDEDFGADDSEPVGFRHEFDVQPFASRSEWTFTQGVGDEVLADLKMTVDLQFDRSVTVRVDGSFWESDDEERTDLEQTRTWSWTVLPGQSQVHRIHMWNEDEDVSDDKLDVMLTVTNERQP